VSQHTAVNNKPRTLREEDAFSPSVHISDSRLRKLTNRPWFCSRTYMKHLYTGELSDAEYNLSITCQEHLLRRKQVKEERRRDGMQFFFFSE